MYKKLKSFVADDLVFTSVLLCGVAIIAFFLGRASVATSVSSASQVGGVGLVTVPTVAPLARATVTPPIGQGVPGGQDTARLVASKTGTKYHLVTCPGAKQIKEENKIYFTSVAEAEGAGYSPAANCPGL